MSASSSEPVSPTLRSVLQAGRPFLVWPILAYYMLILLNWLAMLAKLAFQHDPHRIPTSILDLTVPTLILGTGLIGSVNLCALSRVALPFLAATALLRLLESVYRYWASNGVLLRTSMVPEALLAVAVWFYAVRLKKKGFLV
jgi:hypothetical protein